VAGNVCEKQSADAAGRTTRHIINVTTTLGFAERLAVNPHVQAAQFDATRGKLAAAPDFHALHVLRRGFGHWSIIAAESGLNRIDVLRRAGSEFPTLIAVLLRSRFCWMDVDGGRIDFEMEEPFARDVLAVHFCGCEFPELCGLQCAVGKKLAGPARIEGCFRYIS
jgi:hypothetical protein